MELDNHTPWQATVLPGWSYKGHRQQTLIVKAGYRFEREGQLTPLDTSRELVSVDEYLGDPESSSVTRAAEMVPFKAGFEILVQGRVEPKPNTRMQRLGLSLVRDGQPWWSKNLALFGPRVWQSHLLTGLFPSEPAPLEPTEIGWELAFGGISEDGDARFDENPAGVGWAKRQGRKAKGQAVPQIDREPFISSAGKHYSPAGYSPVAIHWGERAKAFETLDDGKAQEGDSPYTQATPKNLFNCAPKDQQLPSPPKPGDCLRLNGWYPDHPSVDLALPIPAIRCVLLGSGKAVKVLQPQWDTLLVNTTDQEVHLIFRLSLNEADLPDNPRLTLSEAEHRDTVAAQPAPEPSQKEVTA